MKKTLIALAAVAATTVSFAQVTIYGKVDLNLGKAIGATGSATMQQASGSRLGFKGTEDLGGGLSANFQLEERFLPDTGAFKDALAFNGTSVVGLSGGFGSVKFGRTYTAAFGTQASGDVFGWDGVAANVASTAAGVANVRFNNGIFYTSPSFSGFKVAASVGVKEGSDLNAASSLQLSYAAGPLAASVGSEKSGSANKYTGFNVSYDLGMARVVLNSGTGKPAAGGKIQGTTIGAVVPMGAVTLKASYGTKKVDSVVTVQQTGLGMRYALSKRTDLYANVANDSKQTANKSGYEFGIQHNF